MKIYADTKNQSKIRQLEPYVGKDIWFELGYVSTVYYVRILSKEVDGLQYKGIKPSYIYKVNCLPFDDVHSPYSDKDRLLRKMDYIHDFHVEPMSLYFKEPGFRTYTTDEILDMMYAEED